MERDVKRLKVLVILLVILLILVGGYLIYILFFNNKTEEKDMIEDNEIVETTKNYTYEQMEGVYIFTDIELGNKEENVPFIAKLYLWKNGTFKYERSTFAPIGEIGNYIIEDDKIKLNYLFGTNSGAGFVYKKGTKELKINSYDSIYDSKLEFGTSINSDGILTKSTDNQELQRYEQFKYDEYLKSGLAMPVGITN